MGLYTAPKDIQRELARRRKDSGLMQAVLDYVGGELPCGWPLDRPIATLDRYIATARVEDIVFSHAARSLALKPYWPTYLDESYTTLNPEKVSCLRPRIQRGKLQFSNRWLVKNHQSMVGLPLREIRANGIILTQVHYKARLAVLDREVVGNIFDISLWLKQQAFRFGALPHQRLAPYYYNATMALNLCYGVLFEDFHSGPNEGSGLGNFVCGVVEPAIKKVQQEFGLKPLIVRIPYVPGFLEFPSATAEVFDRHREE